ncbi:DUF2946 domain-containing protein [Bordetella sputigena]|uniref:hypothetical protein n=1 Tax=Bordetella sputigena TaxID=1416810 RepID=UPI0039EE6419
MSNRGKQLSQVHRPFTSLARRPTVRVAALLWLWLTVMFGPVGATLHAMSHLALAAETRIASPGMKGDHEFDRDAAPDRDDDRHGAAAHCHVCDEWQFLDKVLPGATWAQAAPAAADSPGPLPLAMRLATETPWILARAPPGREPRFAASH